MTLNLLAAMSENLISTYVLTRNAKHGNGLFLNKSMDSVFVYINGPRHYQHEMVRF